jgi:hypothetical protein
MLKSKFILWKLQFKEKKMFAWSLPPRYWFFKYFSRQHRLKRLLRSEKHSKILKVFINVEPFCFTTPILTHQLMHKYDMTTVILANLWSLFMLRCRHHIVQFHHFDNLEKKKKTKHTDKIVTHINYVCGVWRKHEKEIYICICCWLVLHFHAANM